MTDKASPIPNDAPPSYDTLPASPLPSRTVSNRGRLPPPPPLSLPFLTNLRSKRCILASASPRRRLILTPLFPKLECIPSTFPEDLPKSLSPYEYVLNTATQKALEVYKREIVKESEKGELGIIVAADTIVVSSAGEILEKPRSEAQHISMLRNLRDTGTHKVYTAVACMVPLESARDPGYALETTTVETSVTFDRDASDDLLLAYVKTREGADKAGGYGLQGMGSVLIEKIEGAADNVVGLPLRACVRIMEKCVLKSEDEDLLGDEPNAVENGDYGDLLE